MPGLYRRGFGDARRLLPSPMGEGTRASAIARILCGAGYAVSSRFRGALRPSKSRGDGAPSGASCSLCHAPSAEHVAPLGAPSRRRYGAGPRFRRPHRPAFGSPARPLLGSRTFAPHAGRKARPSASSSRQVIVPAGGAPAPPGSGRSVHLPRAGAASDPTIMTPHDERPRWIGRTHHKAAPSERG